MASKSSRKRKNEARQKAILILLVLIVVVIIICVTMVSKIVSRLSTSKEVTDYSTYYNLKNEESMFVVLNNERLPENGILRDGEAYVYYKDVNDYFNERFYWDDSEQILRYTMPDGLINVGVETADYTYAGTAMTADKPICIMDDEKMYLSMSFVKEYTDIRYAVYDNPNRITISDVFDTVTYTVCKKDTEVRELGGVKSPILTKITKGSLVTVLDEMDTWSKVCTEDGFIGYVKNKTISGKQDIVYDHNFTEPEFTHITKDFKISMAWHQVTNYASNTTISTVLPATQSVNVMSPTWFYMNDNAGGIQSFASADYVNYCHENGVEVWALVSNLENPSIDVTSVLKRTSTRDNLVNNIMSEVIRCGADGINVDFEALQSEAGPAFVQFIRELSLKCESNGIVLSIDNYVPAAYNTLYNRAEQAVFADYVVLMAYDEHYNGSEEAGSVASIPFMTKGIEDTLVDVPKEQLVLGMPFYTRVWKTVADSESSTGYKVTSDAVGMLEAENRAAANNAAFTPDEETNQHYAEWTVDGAKYQIWLEDDYSLSTRLDFMNYYGLAGAAYWKLGFEKSTTWSTIAKFFQ